MQANKLREIWSNGGAVINAWVSLSNGFSAELMANAGFDSVTVDQQHGLAYGESVIGLYQAISTTQAVPMTRVPWLDPAAIMQALDAGAMGIICPMVNSVEDAKRFVDYASYPPMGGRSYGPIRANVYAGKDYAVKANDSIIRMAMIETREALAVCEDIGAVDGIDALYIGPADLASSLGYKPGQDRREPELVAAMERILAAGKAAGIAVGCHNGSVHYAQEMIDKGFQFVTVGSDAIYIAQGAASVVKAFKDDHNSDEIGASSSGY